jgi:ketosteroid isomerase-like protein
MASQADQALAAGKALIEGLKQRDADAVIAVLHEDIVVEVAYPLIPGEDTTGSRRSRGAAVHAYVRDACERTSAMRFGNEIWRTTSDGLAMYEADGDHVLSDGRPYRNHFLFFFEMADGKIVRWREYLSPVAAMRAFGGPLEAIP